MHRGAVTSRRHQLITLQGKATPSIASPGTGYIQVLHGMASRDCRGIHTATHRGRAIKIKRILLTKTAPACGLVQCKYWQRAVFRAVHPASANQGDCSLGKAGICKAGHVSPHPFLCGYRWFHLNRSARVTVQQPWLICNEQSGHEILGLVVITVEPTNPD